MLTMLRSYTYTLSASFQEVSHQYITVKLALFVKSKQTDRERERKKVVLLVSLLPPITGLRVYIPP